MRVFLLLILFGSRRLQRLCECPVYWKILVSTNPPILGNRRSQNSHMPCLFGNSGNDTLLSLVLNLRSPELLDGGSQSVRSGVQIQKTEHGEERHDQIEDLEGLSQMLHVRGINNTQQVRSNHSTRGSYRCIHAEDTEHT